MGNRVRCDNFLGLMICVLPKADLYAFLAETAGARGCGGTLVESDDTERRSEKAGCH